jgi:hypothetical protein
MIRGMGHMLFPRYIQREARDFFYLTARPLLPGAPIDSQGESAGVLPARGPIGAASPEAGEGAWRTKGLPQHGFPYAVATTWIHGDGGAKLRVVRVDPRTMRPGAGSSSEAPAVLALEGGGRGSSSLWWSAGGFAIATDAPSVDAAQLAGGFPFAAPQAGVARGAVGIQDDDGMLVWVELFPQERGDGPAPRAMDSLLERLGCSARMALAGSPHVFLGGSLDAAGEAAAVAPPSATRFLRIEPPDARPMFTDTPIVPIQVWRPLQAKRVRYFYKPHPAASASASVSGSSASPSPPASAWTNADHPPIRVQSRP